MRINIRNNADAVVEAFERKSDQGEQVVDILVSHPERKVAVDPCDLELHSRLTCVTRFTLFLLAGVFLFALAKIDPVAVLAAAVLSYPCRYQLTQIGLQITLPIRKLAILILK